MNPIAQTFFVATGAYPSGVFLASIDLCFRGKPENTNLPVTLQIRPTDNGFPSGAVILPFSEVILYPHQVKTSSTPSLNDATTYTRFTFSAPVYLSPGEYAIVLSSNDPDYEVYTAILGEPIIGSDRIVSSQPYVGVFFKSSNASTYTAIQNEDLMFRINKCKFNTNTVGTVTFKADDPSANVLMDVGYIMSQEIAYGAASIQWAKRTTSNSAQTLESSFNSVEANENFQESERKIVRSSPSGENGKLYLKASLLTPDANVSPILDISRLSLAAVQNYINNDSTDEEDTFGGNAYSRYISRRVTLADGFDSNALQVFITANKQQVASIKVYAKVLSREDPDTFDAKSWIELDQITSSTLFSQSDEDFYEFQFAASAESDLLTYESNGVTYESFGTFAIKIVLLSSDPTKVPRIADMRAIALPA